MKSAVSDRPNKDGFLEDIGRLVAGLPDHFQSAVDAVYQSQRKSRQQSA